MAKINEAHTKYAMSTSLNIGKINNVLKYISYFSKGYIVIGPCKSWPPNNPHLLNWFHLS